MLREIVTIDEDLCDGCGQCVPACHEGALRIVEGKARLVADRLCDGLGACLGQCPRGAIRIERRESEAFDEAAVAAHLGRISGCAGAEPSLPESVSPARTPMEVAGGCPGSRFAGFAARRGSPADGATSVESTSELTHWPVQLHLLSASAPVLRGARLLVTADCVPIAYADFHAKLLREHAVVIACPKLDDTGGYVEKLTEIIRLNDPAEVTVAHMEVPCCLGLWHMVLEARRCSGRRTPVNEVTVSIRGEVRARREHPALAGGPRTGAGSRSQPAR